MKLLVLLSLFFATSSFAFPKYTTEMQLVGILGDVIVIKQKIKTLDGEKWRTQVVKKNQKVQGTDLYIKSVESTSPSKYKVTLSNDVILDWHTLKLEEAVPVSEVKSEWLKKLQEREQQFRDMKQELEEEKEQEQNDVLMQQIDYIAQELQKEDSIHNTETEGVENDQEESIK